MYWQYMHYDCMFAVRKREERQLRKGKYTKDGAPPMETGPRALECNDFGSINLKVLPSGKQMRLVVDYLSHDIGGDILESKTGLEAAKFFYRTFLRNDHPARILSDNGGEFRNRVAAECESEWHIGRRFITPEHPCANGLSERMNGVVAGYTAKLGGNELTREDSFRETLAAYNPRDAGRAPQTPSGSEGKPEWRS